MPHQCLKCGKIFVEGSSELLKGCSDCGGNRFFFTKEPLDQKQRQDISEKVGKDINTRIMEMMGPDGEQLVDQSGNWVKIKPKDLRKAMAKHLPESDDSVKADTKDEIDVVTDAGYRKAAIEKVKSEMDNSHTPETIEIERAGSYKIDIKGLLEEEPIIIEKDGSYTIHLPSIFKMLDKEK